MSFTIGLISYQILPTVEPLTVLVDRFFGNGALVIPPTVSDGTNTYSVVQVGGGIGPLGGFMDVSKVCTSVQIPTTVTIINDCAFRSNTKLTTVTFDYESTLTTIGFLAFEGCTSLTSVTIPPSVTSIGYDAFSGCNLTSSVTIPSSVNSIGDGAFFNNPSLETIIFSGNKPSGGIGDISNSAPYGVYPPRNSTWRGTTLHRGINFSKKPTPAVFVDLSNFQLLTCPSSIVIDKVEGKVMTASISPFFKDLYYAFHVDGVKVLDNIQTPTFQYTFPIPGCRNVYIVSSTDSTVNRGKSTNPANIVSVCVF